MKKLMILLFVLLAAGCMQAPQTDLEGLKAMRDVWQSAFDARDPAAVAAIYAEDGALMPPNSDTVIGRAAIEAFWADFQASGISGEIKDTEVYAHGDVGYKIGTYTVTDPGGATIDEGKYVEIWRHVDGKWQMYRDIWNSELPLPGVAAQTQAKIEATIFAYDGQDFVRTQTTLATEDGKSAVDTKLDHDTSAYEALIEKRSYAGDATLFGRNYEANYAPLTGEDGRLTGALFVAVTK